MNKEVLVSYWQGKISSKVLEAFKSTPREEFVTRESVDIAYEDKPLPILRGKTISQPSTVLIMTEALELKSGHNVLEIGSGSGYQAALIAKIIAPGNVTSTEVIPELIHFARENIRRIGIRNITIIEHDGSQGYEANAQYDRIVMTAASPNVPLHLIDQLKVNGILIAPTGDLNNQQMLKIVKRKNHIEQQNLGDFVFSPLVGKFGFDEDKFN
jgi:protein-L-isoaspartate(D-aspartate) O-methyltransferase